MPGPKKAVTAGSMKQNTPAEAAKSDIKFIFVHGLCGWGSYDAVNKIIPYWGLTSGDVIRYLNDQGYESYAASVSKKGSAWDRACELYAQLTGTRVDYGAAHSKRAGHKRYGRDYSKKPLLRDFSESKFVLLGHSFGGATIRLFSEILRNGDEDEISNTDPSELSPFFKRGGGDNLKAVITLSAPTNGSTAYDIFDDSLFDTSFADIPKRYDINEFIFNKAIGMRYDGRQHWDNAEYDMHIDNALSLNKRITTFDDVYYFAYLCSSVKNNRQGELTSDPRKTESIYIKRGILMSRYTGTTPGGFRIDESWKANDGLVNEISAKEPLGEPAVEYRRGQEIKPGVWNIMPTIAGDHMYLQGGMTKRVDVRPFYLRLAKMLTSLNDNT